MFFHVVCVFVISVFKLCGLQGDERWDLWLLDWESKWACGRVFGFGGGWGLGRGMRDGTGVGMGK